MANQKAKTSGKPAFTEVDEAMIAQWKEKHNVRRVTEIELPVFDDEPNGEKAKFYLIPPSRNVIYAVTVHVKNDRLKQANELTINSCVLAGDMELLADESNDLYFGVLEQIGELQSKSVASVKKR